MTPPITTPDRLRAARALILKLVAEYCKKAQDAEICADLDRAVLAAKFTRLEERGVEEVTCFGWTRAGALRDADAKWQQANEERLVAETALELADGSITGALASLGVLPLTRSTDDE